MRYRSLIQNISLLEVIRNDLRGLEKFFLALFIAYQLRFMMIQMLLFIVGIFYSYIMLMKSLKSLMQSLGFVWKAFLMIYFTIYKFVYLISFSLSSSSLTLTQQTMPKSTILGTSINHELYTICLCYCVSASAIRLQILSTVYSSFEYKRKYCQL